MYVGLLTGKIRDDVADGQLDKVRYSGQCPFRVIGNDTTHRALVNGTVIHDQVGR